MHEDKFSTLKTKDAPREHYFLNFVIVFRVLDNLLYPTFINWLGGSNHASEPSDRLAG